MTVDYVKGLSNHVGGCNEPGHGDEEAYPVLVVTLSFGHHGYSFRVCEQHWRDSVRPAMRFVPEWYDAGWGQDSRDLPWEEMPGVSS